MARRRPDDHDHICRRCGCTCDQAGTRHLGGGPGMRACPRPPDVILRRDHDADMDAIVAALVTRRP